MKRKTYLFPNETHVFSMLIIPNNGNKAMGSKEVAPIGKHSVIHHTSIHEITPKVFAAAGSSPKG